MKILGQNRRARFEYELLERFVAGIALTGPEVKSVREGRINLQEGHVTLTATEAFLTDVHITPYDHAGLTPQDPTRKRKLLLHRREIHRLFSKVTEKGLTVVPLAIGVEGNWIKVEIALAKGKKLHDKRETLRKRTMDREAHAAIKDRR